MINASPSNTRYLCKKPRGFVLLAAFIVVGALLALPLFIGSASAPITSNDQSAVKHKIDNSTSSSTESVVIPGFYFQTPPAPFSSVTVNTFAGDCTTPKTTYNLQDTDLTVCAKFTGASTNQKVVWSNAKDVAVQTTAITAANSSATFTLNANSSLGDWRVIILEPFGGGVYAASKFTVADAGNPEADLSVEKGALGSASSGAQLVFSVRVTNNGPSTAAAVDLSDVVPANTTFVSFQQLDGPTFTCTSPNEGETGTTDCTITSMLNGDSATFLATYLVGAVATGTAISNSASVVTTTSDPVAENNSVTTDVDVTNAPCVLSTPDNITVSADTGQAGAVVTYTTPTGTGFCGTTSTGENGETIPAITCNPPSGSFFPVGTTPVICTAQTGAAVTFQVTVDNPGALSISLNGGNSLTLECGQRFGDPGATAINGSGQSLDVTVSYSGGFDPDAPAVGTYTATYTATEGTNSVSAERTLTVSDTEAPAITIDGANPYRIQTGSCSPFVDPGASAFDTCAGTKPVTSSISGPGGATSVNTSVAGTYTVTYTATDGTHQATATRTVIVGTFSQDEVDQPATANVPPTLTLNGDDQMTLECGNAFVDPGATATVCGSPVNVTVSGTVNVHQPGTYTLTYTAVANGFTTEATRLVTVQDTVAPVITLNGPDPLVWECHTTFTDPGATAEDGCEGPVAVSASGTVNANVVGSYLITYTASDSVGHTTTRTRTVNVVDTTKPVVTAPANVTVYTNDGGGTTCNMVVSNAQLGTATASDACQGSLSTTRTGVPAGNVFPVGTTTITYSATDAYNNTGTATQTVTVIDNTQPVISCPSNITLEPSCPTGAIATWTPPVGTDNCASTTTRTAGPAPGSVFPIGATTVTYTVVDASGNSASCSFTVTVKTAAQVVQDLITRTQALQPPLTGQQAQGLLSKLNQALTSINSGSIPSACGKLGDYVTQVQNYINNGTLTAAQGQPLINSANKVRNTIGCTSNPCT